MYDKHSRFCWCTKIKQNNTVNNHFVIYLKVACVLLDYLYVEVHHLTAAHYGIYIYACVCKYYLYSFNIRIKLKASVICELSALDAVFANLI